MKDLEDLKEKPQEDSNTTTGGSSSGNRKVDKKSKIRLPAKIAIIIGVVLLLILLYIA